MTFNTDRRKPLTKKQRAAFLLAHHCTCYYCRLPITDDAWDDEHMVAKELMPPGSDWNDMSNRAPIHRLPCHKAKTASDRKAIAKSNRLRRSNGPAELRKARKPIPRPKNTRWPSRPMQNKGWK